MILVLDTDVIVAAIRSPGGASAALVGLLIEGRGTLALSVALALEYESIATMAEHVMAGKTTTDAVCNLLEVLFAIASPVESNYQHRPQLSDAGDELVLEAAINGYADAIVSFNQKDYKRDHQIVPERFGIKLMLPNEAVRQLRDLTH